MSAQPFVLAQSTSLHLPMQDQSVHCCITSPPYFGLRRYEGVEPSCWPGGAYAPVPGATPVVIPGPTPEDMASCAHAWGPTLVARDHGSRHGKGPGSTLTGGRHVYDGLPDHAHEPSTTCLQCGCWRGMLGNEDAPGRYVWHVLLVLREIRRVLRDDGVCWLVLGDSYAPARGHGHWDSRQGKGDEHGQKQTKMWATKGAEDIGYLPGCLLGIPAQVMLAAMADGWVVRNDVVWAKASCMPESIRGWRWQQASCTCLQASRLVHGQQKAAVTGKREQPHGGVTAILATTPDPACPQCGGSGVLAEDVLRKGSWRHTRSHETILMLTKGMSYFANGEAVREAGTLSTLQRDAYPRPTYHELNADPKGGGFRGIGGIARTLNPAGRNPRDVVTPRSTSLALDHYAAFPPALIAPLIQATCPERVCPQCGSGWAPVIMHSDPLPRPDNPNPVLAYTGASGHTNGTGKTTLHMQRHSTVHGLRPTCTHYCTCGPLAPPPGVLVSPATPCPQCDKFQLSYWHPGIVLDPFVGAGTTALVTRALGRRSVGLDLSFHYLQAIARARLGLTNLARWEGQNDPASHETFGDLPLFALSSEEGLL